MDRCLQAANFQMVGIGLRTRGLVPYGSTDDKRYQLISYLASAQGCSSVDECKNLTNQQLVSRCQLILAPQIRSDGKGVFGANLYSPGRSHRLSMQTNGRLILYQESGTGQAALWAAFTAVDACEKPTAFCTHPGGVYTFEDCDGDGIADPVCRDGAGQVGFYMSSRQCELVWPNGVCTPAPDVGLVRAVLQADGNFVRYHSDDSGGYGRGSGGGSGSVGSAFVFASWSSNTNTGITPHTLAVQNDGRVAIYDNTGNQVWIVGTGCSGMDFDNSVCCADRLDWYDPLNGELCASWIGYDCNTQYAGFSAPSVINANCKATCGHCASS